MNLAAWLLSMVGPIVIRGIISIGFVLLTFTGVTEIVASLVTQAQTNWASMPSAVLQLLALSGVPQVMGMLFGVLGVRVAMWSATAASRFIYKK